MFVCTQKLESCLTGRCAVIFCFPGENGHLPSTRIYMWLLHQSMTWSFQSLQSLLGLLPRSLSLHSWHTSWDSIKWNLSSAYAGHADQHPATVTPISLRSQSKFSSWRKLSLKSALGTLLLSVISTFCVSFLVLITFTVI